MPMRENVSLKNLNTFGIEAKARYFIEINSEDELKSFLLQHKKTALPLLVMGGGSNMLFFKDFDGIVLKNNLNGISVVEENETYVKVRVGAGEVWHNVVMWSVEKNLGGLENLSLIPGTAGAAPIQNIGAYGVEIKNSLVAVEAMAIDSAEKKVFSNQECEFGYRNSVFKNAVKGKYIITAIILELKKQPQFKTEYGAIQSELEKLGITTLSVKAISDAVIAIRKSKLPDPAMIGNAGSFFKNPEITDKEFEKIKQQHPNIPHYPAGENKIKLAAGWLIEQCGWKGFREGDAGCHKNQALVLVNYGNATGAEIYNLALKIKESVYNHFGVHIEPEVNIIQ